MPPKPKRPPAAALRARNGDLGAKLELTLAWLSAVASGKQRLSLAQAIALGALGALALALCGGLYLYLASRSVRLHVSDGAALKQVFLSGEPWLVECTTAGPSDVLYRAEAKLHGKLRTALLDCGATLPSGKTATERFKLKPPAKGPFILAVSNLELPVTAGYDAVASPAALTKWALSATKPKVLSIGSSAQLDKSCLKKKWCVLVLGAGSRLLDGERKALSSLSQQDRGVRFVTVDSSKSTLLLDLPGGVTPPTAQSSTVLLLKQLASPAGGIAALALESGLAQPEQSLAAIRAAVAANDDLPAGFTPLDKRPMLKVREVPKPQASQPSERQRGGSSKTLTDEELKALKAERMAEAARLKREAEQQRREEMAAEEANAGNILEEAPLDEESEDEAEEEEAEAMELDD